jgi:hypothetical protein
MLKGLMHNLMGSNIIGNHGAQGIANSGLTSSQLTQAMQNSILKQAPMRSPSSKRIFMGNIEVLHVSNGYVVNIGTREGYEYTTHIASSITEVNEIIAAAMVAFQLENS